jgi:hypothetical protein
MKHNKVIFPWLRIGISNKTFQKRCICMAVKSLVKTAGAEVISVKSGLWPPSLLPIFGPKATQKTVFMIRNQSN